MSFFIFFPVVVLLYYIIPDRMKKYWLLGAGFYFYTFLNPKNIIILLFCITLTYVCARQISGAGNDTKRKLWLWTCIGVCLGVLFFGKYYNFATGISFYIFQALGYTADVYRREVPCEKNYFDHALFVSFFPLVLSGPIERSVNLLPQLKQPRRFDERKVQSGLLLMMAGYFEKLVVAETAAIAVNYAFENFRRLDAPVLIFGMFAFSVQLYADFSGYSHIAIGAAKVLGIEIMQNFRQPYLATSVREFWHRWHISLSGWLRDYLYIPLGGSKKGTLRKYVNLCTVFLASGLWHGISWHFVFWGLLNGAGQVLEDVRSRCHMKKLPKIPAMLNTFVFWSVTLIFFRSPSLREGFEYLWYMLTGWQKTGMGLSCEAFGFTVFEMLCFVAGIVILFVTDRLREAQRPPEELLLAASVPVRWIFCLLFCLLIVLVAFRSFGQSASSFIYFQF